MVIKMDQKNKQAKKSAVKAEPKSLLEDWQGFRAWQGVGSEPSLRQKLEALTEQRKKLQTEIEGLWEEQRKEAKPVDDKYSKKRQELNLMMEKLSSEIEILQHAIGEQMASSAPEKSALGDIDTFRSYQEALYNSRGKRIPTV